MKVLAVITLLSAIVFSSCNKAKQVSGTYIIQSEMLPKVNGCCANTEIIRLNEDQTFSMYHQNDQGDYTTKDFAQGTFQLTKGVVSLKPDSVNSNLDLSKATFRKDHADHGLDYLTRLDNKAKYHKIDFKKSRFTLYSAC
ncbi:lipocalin family protein [Chryseobacterium aurantiacum]|uniref:lipocalin family protein n=1 Tax=Chryseobacterium aurantiacum TaxID=2116499 RepID=UPI000D11ACE8|nr:lipocalin family protein [Chryseobacterium aurantiacum]